MKVYINFKIFHDNSFKENYVVVADKQIIDVLQKDKLEEKYGHESYETIDGNGQFLVPGFIDTHVHGGNGYDVMDGTNEALKNISKGMIQSGVVAYLATTMTMKESIIEEALINIRDYIGKQNEGAEIVGVHLEGPFINKSKKGAQDPQYIINPDIDFIEKYKDIIEIVTYAPEMDEDLSFTKAILEMGIQLSIGHSNASFETCQIAHDMGVKRITHCYNAMRPFQSRDPGVVGAAMTLPFNVEVISDYVHSHPQSLKLLSMTKDANQITLITDAMRANYLEDGMYDLGGQKVIVKSGKATLEDGVIAGSVLKLDDGLRKFMKASERPFEDVIKMVTINPAQAASVDHRLGSIEEGKDASFVVIDESYLIKGTIIKNKWVYRV